MAGAETTGLGTVVAGVLGCGAGVCAEAMEVIKAIATRAISGEIMRVFMRVILPAGSAPSNKKAKDRKAGGQRSEIRGQRSVKPVSARILRADRRVGASKGSEKFCCRSQ